MTENLVVLLIFISIGFFIVTFIFGTILKHFIREAIKEAYEEMGMYERK